MMHRLLALVGLIVSFPVGVLTAILIKLESRGPVFYKQERVGKNGHIFNVIKFRSMRTLDEGRHIPQAMADDPRITRVGRFLRRTNIDELPQLS